MGSLGVSPVIDLLVLWGFTPVFALVAGQLIIATTWIAVDKALSLLNLYTEERIVTHWRKAVGHGFVFLMASFTVVVAVLSALNWISLILNT